MFDGSEMLWLMQAVGGVLAGLVGVLVFIAGCTALRRLHDPKD